MGGAKGVFDLGNHSMPNTGGKKKNKTLIFNLGVKISYVFPINSKQTALITNQLMFLSLFEAAFPVVKEKAQSQLPRTEPQMLLTLVHIESQSKGHQLTCCCADPVPALVTY